MRDRPIEEQRVIADRFNAGLSDISEEYIALAARLAYGQVVRDEDVQELMARLQERAAERQME